MPKRWWQFGSETVARRHTSYRRLSKIPSADLDPKIKLNLGDPHDPVLRRLRIPFPGIQGSTCASLANPAYGVDLAIEVRLHPLLVMMSGMEVEAP